MTAHTAITAQVDGIMRKARTWHICQGGSWMRSCGRRIEAGERYLSFGRGALSHFSVCEQCAAPKADAVYAAQLERARHDLTLDKCRAIVGDNTIRPALSWETLSPEAMTDALFAIAGGRVKKVGL